MKHGPLLAVVAACLTALGGCASGPQVPGWYPASLDADMRNYEGIVAASSYEPEDEALAAMRTLGAIARSRYRLDHLSANVAGFERSPADWDRMSIEVLSAYGIATRLAALPVDQLAKGGQDPEIAEGLAQIRSVVGWWGGAPTPTSGTRRVRP